LDIRLGEVATACPQCGKGFHLVIGALRPVEIEFVLSELQSGITLPRPFWALLSEMPLSLCAAWGADLVRPWFNIYVPAYTLPREQAVAIGTQLTHWQPHYSPGPRGELRGCTLTQQQAFALADLIYLGLLDLVMPRAQQISPERPILLSTKIIVIPTSEGKEPA